MTEIIVPRRKVQCLGEERTIEPGGECRQALVTGAGGYLGYLVAEEMLRKGAARQCEIRLGPPRSGVAVRLQTTYD